MPGIVRRVQAGKSADVLSCYSMTEKIMPICEAFGATLLLIIDYTLSGIIYEAPS